MSIVYVLIKRSWIGWLPWPRLCGGCGNFEFTVTIASSVELKRYEIVDLILHVFVCISYLQDH